MSQICALSLEIYESTNWSKRVGVNPDEQPWQAAFLDARSKLLLLSCFAAAKKSSSTEVEAKERLASGDGGQAGFSDDNARWLTPSASGKKRARPEESDEDSVALRGSDGNEGFLESEEEVGSEDGMVDDYGALSSEEEDEVRTLGSSIEEWM